MIISHFLFIVLRSSIVSVNSIMFLLEVMSTLSVFSFILMGIHYWTTIKEYIILRKKFVEVSKVLPSPPTYPIIGNAHLLKNTDELFLELTKFCREVNKNFCFWLGPVPKVIITDPRDCEILMNTPLAADKEDIYGFMGPVAEDGLINGRGAKYRAHKKIFMPLVNGKPLSKYRTEFNKQANRLVENLREKSGRDEFDIYDDINSCVADIVWDTLYGITGKAQDGNRSWVIARGERALRLFTKRAYTFWLHPEIIFKLSHVRKEFFSLSDKIHEWFDHLIASKKEQKKKNFGLSSHVSLLDGLLDHISETNSWTDSDLRDELIIVLFAAHDTIAGLVSFSLLMLAMHPEAQEKVRKEIEDLIGDGIITEEITNNMEYTEMVLKEIIRLFPIAPMQGRKLTGNIKLTNCELPKGCGVGMLTYALHRDPDFWTDPEKFDPERFTKENSKDRHPYAYIPFSAGPRKCPGFIYGMMCLKVIIADVVRNFKLKTTMTMENVKLFAHVSVKSDNGYNLSIEKIEKKSSFKCT